MSCDSTGRCDRAAAALLAGLGGRVRMARARRGMTRRALARDSGVSERYLAQLEAGGGNPSVAILARIAAAMACPATDLLRDGGRLHPARRRIADWLERLPDDLLDPAWEHLRTAPPALAPEPGGKAGRIALVGLRGAGKSTLGAGLARHLGCPFIELNRMVERDYGAGIGELLALSGQPALRRYERRCLERAIERHRHAVIETGGGIVADRGTYDLLLARTRTIWLHARPEDHMARVRSQGDLRPMARNPEAMADLKAILAAREARYARCEARLDTSLGSEAESLARLTALAGRLLAGAPMVSAA